ncbi:glycosyltransferase family protein [Empedobacter falsenii]
MKKKIIIHCQYVYGIGHFVRTIQLATTLVNEFEVYILNGGQNIDKFPIDPRIQIINIPAIYKSEKRNQLIPVDNEYTLEQCFDKRKQIISKTLERIVPDVIITEHFPFGFLFKEEALSYISNAKTINQNVKVVASVREVIENNNGSPNDYISIEILNKEYDLLLIHGDENIIHIKESFPLINQLKINHVHTGYIVQHIESFSRNNEHYDILVSVGAGRLGSELLQKVIDSYNFLNKNEFKLTLFTGVFQENKHLLETEWNDIEVLEFNRELYISKLASCDVVISLGGYNSMIEAISLNKKLLVYNREFAGDNLEQDIRISTFNKLNLLDSFSLESTPKQLAIKIIEIVNKNNNKEIKINCQGATNSLTEIKKLI